MLSAALDDLRGIYHGSTLLALGHAMHEGAVEAAKPDGERETAYRARNLPFLVKRLAKRLADLHPPHEAALLRRAAAKARCVRNFYSKYLYFHFEFAEGQNTNIKN